MAVDGFFKQFTLSKIGSSRFKNYYNRPGQYRKMKTKLHTRYMEKKKKIHVKNKI